MRPFYLIIPFLVLLLTGCSVYEMKQVINTIEANYVSPLPDTASEEIMICQLPPVASFPGGITAWVKYIQDSTFYPEIAYDHKTGGVARIQFTISEEGNVTDVRPLTELKDSLNEEAMRVIKASPKWIPAERNGEPVTYRMVTRITFQWEPEEDEKQPACDSLPEARKPLPVS